MNELEFDKALSDFLDDDQCEATSEAVYQLIRAAFAAGWKAALGGQAGGRTQKQLSSGLAFGSVGAGRSPLGTSAL